MSPATTYKTIKYYLQVHYKMGAEAVLGTAVWNDRMASLSSTGSL